MNSDKTIALGQWPAMSVNADGSIVETQLAVGLRVGSKNFVADLPPYVSKSGQVENESLQKLIESFESACDAYSRRKLASPVLMVLEINAPDTDKEVWLDAAPRFIIGGFVGGWVHEVTNDGGIGRRLWVVNRNEFVYVPNTPELRAKVEQLQASICTAAGILHGLTICENPEQYLLNISNDWQPSADSPAAKAALPTDDEEL